jgi:hypothetical protein
LDEDPDPNVRVTREKNEADSTVYPFPLIGFVEDDKDNELKDDLAFKG